jgi:hypothetical protein
MTVLYYYVKICRTQVAIYLLYYFLVHTGLRVQTNKQVESFFLNHNLSIHFCCTDSFLMTHRGGLSLRKTISAENVAHIGFRGFGKNYQGEPSCLVLSTCLHKNINQFKVKLKSIYQHLVETADTNIW